MSQEAVARRYARAVFEIAKDNDELAQVETGLRGFVEAYESSEDFQALDQMPSLDEEQRAQIVASLGAKLGAGETTIRTVSLLARRQRLAALSAILDRLTELSDEHLGVLRARVRSAKKLTAAYQAQLKKKIEEATGKTVVMQCEEDPSLIAGIVTQIGDRVVDGSIRGKLNVLAASLRQQ